MDIRISPALRARIGHLVEAGSYDSADAVIGEALRLLERRDELREQQFEELRAEIAIGLDDLATGRSAPLDMKTIRAKMTDRVDRSETEG